MRADRLLAIMMLLQARGKMTTLALAEELEVSRRTILRDIGALSIAGVPIYADGGHGGGVALDAHYRTTLTGLTEAETLTLFVSGIPNMLQDLGFRDRARQTLLKLSAALPDLHRNAIDQFRQRVHIDPVWWWNEATPPFWDALQQGVYEARLLNVTYERFDGSVVERTLEPYSLVVKAGIWYLVARREQEFRTYRVSRMRAAKLQSAYFARSEDFDLAAYWSEHTEQISAQMAPYHFSVRCNEQGLAFLRRHTLELEAIEDAAGGYTIQLRVASGEEAKMLVFGLGTDGMVLSPPELQDEVRRALAMMLDQTGQ
jgi:predicted DNA-binding transcriptional regulator YafY